MYRPTDRNGESEPMWARGEQAHRATFEPQPQTHDGTLAAEVLIVGAGIAGLSTAYELLKRGHSVIVLDKSAGVGVGETSRSTAHLSDALDDRYVLLERVHGRKGARLAAESHRAGIESIARVVTEEKIDCAFERVDGYLFEHRERPSALLRHELAAASRAGVQVEWLDAFPAFQAHSALKFLDQAQIDPLAYARGLAEAIRRHGGHIYTLSQVQDIQRERDHATVTLESGLRFEGRDVVVATNSPIHDMITIHTKQAAYRSYVVGFEASALSIPRALFWDTEDPYHYLRFAGSTLLVGGADHRVGQSRSAPSGARAKKSDPEASFHELERWTRELLPDVGPVTSHWSGQIMEPMDGLGFIGHNPGDGTYIVTGDSGNGMTHGALAALLIADLITGIPNAWASLYDPSRKATKLPSLKEYLLENAKVAVAYTDWLKPAQAMEEPIPRGQGQVVQDGLHKLAVYVDDAGERHECSATCPHLGGVVRWNAAERSWDCPCHGSRFDPLGEVLAGPANRGLAHAHPRG